MEFFATTETDQVYLFGGTEYWIAIKKGLTAGEERQLQGAALRRISRPTNADGTIGDSVGFDLDLDRAAFTKVAVYLSDWNITGRDGKTVEIKSMARKVDALRDLNPDVFTAIEKAIDDYVLARLQEKKAQSTPSS